jgi:hypothetical protein
MIKFLRWILGLCNHEWEETKPVWLQREKDVVAYGLGQVLVCGKCKCMKFRRVA